MFVGETNWQNHINRCIHCNPNLNFTYEMSEEVLKDPIEVIDLTQEDKSQEESIIHLGNEMEKIIFDDSSKVSKSSAKKHSFM